MSTTLKACLVERMQRALALTESLWVAVPASQRAARLPELRSNSVGSQMWCVVGARTSYTAAIRKGSWKGFTAPYTRDEAVATGGLVQERLHTAGADALEAVRAVLESGGSDSLQFVFDLLEHEVQHHGQLVRYFYGNGWSFPKDVAGRYALKN